MKRRWPSSRRRRRHKKVTGEKFLAAKTEGDMTHEIRSGQSSKTGRVFLLFCTNFDFLNCEKGTIVPTCFMLSLIAILY